jgi:hypothetical protein
MRLLTKGYDYQLVLTYRSVCLRFYIEDHSKNSYVNDNSFILPIDTEKHMFHRRFKSIMCLG